MDIPSSLYLKVEQAVQELEGLAGLAASGGAMDWTSVQSLLVRLKQALELQPAGESPPCHVHPPVKQVLVVRTDLPMPAGKQVSQGAHGAVNALALGRGARIVTVDTGHELRVPLDLDAKVWLESDFRKVVLGVKSESALLALHEKVQAAGLRCYLVRDNGLTVFDGEKTYTALAIGPHEDRVIDAFTKRLRLLGPTSSPTPLSD